MAKMVPLKLIKDNPWRDKTRNPINPETVEILAESMDTTQEFWEGVYGREVDGFVELAFGHHRLDAARVRELKEVPITIRKFTDGEMLVWMIRENTKGEFLVVIEAISAAVRALGEGKIEIEPVASRTNDSVIRWAPSYVEGKQASGTPGVPHPYTADTLARFLGRQYFRPTSGKASNSVRAALGILELEELKVKGFSEKQLQVDRVWSDGKYKSAKDIIVMVSEIKHKEIRAKERAEKSAEEISLADKAARTLQEKQKKREAKEKKEHDELISKRVAAQVEKNAAEVKRLQQQIKDKAEEAEAKAEADKAKLKVLDADLAAKKEAAKEQAKVDEYLPIRREADRIIHILERRDVEEDVKALSRRPLNNQDRERVRQAAMTLGTWYTEWVSTRFLPPSTPRKRVTTKEKR
jgi:hypothetical protein